MEKAASESPVRPIAFALLIVYLASAFTRLTELLGGSLHLPVIVLSVVTGLMLVTCRPTTIVRNPANILLVCFSLWMMLCVPFSAYPGGSVNMLLHVWANTAALALCLGALPKNLNECSRLMKTLAVGVAIIVLIYFSSAANAGRAELDSSATLGNPNILAMQLEMGLPFLALPLMRRASVLSFLSLGFLGLGVVITLKTGSRAGLLALLFLLAAGFLFSSPSRKMIYGIGSLVAVVLMVTLLPSDILSRYGTLVGDETDISAEQSSMQRKRNLEQSIRLSFTHPLFGVGPGEFIVAAAEDSAGAKERASWLETHNSYTQVSSETGVAGFLLYAGFLAACFVPLVGLYRKTRLDPRYNELNRLVLILLLAVGATLINANFSSTAYQLYLPALGGIAVAVVRCGRAELALVSTAPVSRPFMAFATSGMAVPAPQNPSAAAFRPANPVRFGRLRRGPPR